MPYTTGGSRSGGSLVMGGGSTTGEGKPVGVGLHLVRAATGEVLVRDVKAGGVAAAAGVQPGSAILSVDGNAVSGMDTRQVAQMILGEDGSVITFQLKLPDSSEIHVVSLVRAAAARTTQQPALVPPQNSKSAALPPAYSDRNVPQSGAGVPADHNSQLAEPVQTQSQEGSDGRVRDWLASSSGTTQPAEPDREEGGFAGSLATPPLAPKLHQLAPDYEGDVSSAPSRSVLAKSKEFAAHIIQLVEAQDVQLREEVGETVSKLLHTINAAMREFDKERFQIQQDAKTTRDLANKVLELQDAVASLSTPGTTYRDGAQIQYQQYVPPGHQGSPMGSVQENAVYDEGYEDQHRDHVVLREEAVM